MRCLTRNQSITARLFVFYQDVLQSKCFSIRRCGWPIFITVLLTTAACSNNTITSSDSPDIFFPRTQQRNGLTALLIGQLVEVNKCLRVISQDSGTSYLLIWPPDYAVRIGNNEVNIFNAKSQIVARVGNRIQVSGGAFGEGETDTNAPAPSGKPSNCLGPYWQVNQVLP